MEKNRKARKGILIVLLLLVVGLSIGFAGFTDILNITNMTATVSPSADTFKVAFSTSDSEMVGGAIETDGKYAQASTITAETTEISNLTARFTEPGQIATWKFYAFNGGEFDAYLNSVEIGEITYEISNESNVDENKVKKVMEGISISVNVGTVEYTDATSGELTGHILSKPNANNNSNAEEIIVTLTYANNDADVRADGDFTIKVGYIKLN